MLKKFDSFPTVDDKLCQNKNSVLVKEKQKKSYCEICKASFDDVDIHLKTSLHVRNVESLSYSGVDEVINKLPEIIASSKLCMFCDVTRFDICTFRVFFQTE